MMNLSQTKLVGLTMELDLKAREYKSLCDKLDKLKENKVDANDDRLLVVEELFQKNYDDIVKINTQIKELKRKNDISKVNREENTKISVVQTRKNIFTKLIEKIKAFFSK